MKFVALWVALAALALAAPPAAAQDTTAQDVGTAGGRVLTVRVAGVAHAIPCACYLDGLRLTKDRSLLITGIGLRWTMAGGPDEQFELGYAVELLPLIVSRGTADSRLRVSPCGTRGDLCAIVNSPEPWTTNATGAGILPIGVVTRVRVARGLHFLFRTAGGVVRLSRPVPLLEGHKFNFIAEIAPAAELRVSDRHSLVAGMTYNHISNGGTAAVNPGMDSRLLEIGMQLRR